MYTECPECGTAFRVTAKVLQQARGNVRCGGCSHAFNALEFLSEEMPGTSKTQEPEAPVDELAETSRRLLETLDDLAGPDEIRIEDTGVEWRVLEDLQSGIDVDASNAGDEPRYDDNSPLPDDFDEDDEPVVLADPLPEGDEDPEVVSQPKRRLTDTHFSVEFSEKQGDLALADPEEWNDLLDEVQDAEQGSLEVEEELASIHTQLAGNREQEATELHDVAAPEPDPEPEIESESEKEEAEAEAEAEEIELADIDTQFNLQAEALGLERIDSEDALTDEVPLLPGELAAADDAEDDGASTQGPQGERPDDRSGDESMADRTRPDPGDDSQTGINEALTDDFDATAETGVNETLSEKFDGDIESGINEAVAEEFDQDFESGITEALSEDLDDDSDSEIKEALPEALDDDAETGINEALESSTARIDSSAEIDSAEEAQRDDESASSVSTRSDDQNEAVSDEGDSKTLADMIRESTGEFEAQIEAAAEALANDEEKTIDADDVESALDKIEAKSEQVEPVDDTSEVPTADDESELTDSGHLVPPQTDEEMTVNKEIDQELMALAIQDDEFAATLVGADSADFPFNENSGEVEAIVMEGEEVRSDVEDDRLAAESAARNQLDDPIDLADTYATSREKLFGGRRKYDPPGYAVIAAMIALVVVLGAQFIHNSREILATTGFFNHTIGPVYRMLGDPVTPAWNIKGWQFEVTNGSIEEAESALVIVSKLVNRDANPLPYPLVHVSLTDRWEDVMGSRILEPGEYLAGAVDPGQPVLPGENFTAVITIENPSEEATGFKLNVCYREGPETVRCAIEDFKN
ncbi:MAG: DUF3426 domain-containing protein [Woeseiaceae bacterium]